MGQFGAQLSGSINIHLESISICRTLHSWPRTAVWGKATGKTSLLNMLLLANHLPIYAKNFQTLVWYMVPGLERQHIIHVSYSVSSNVVLFVSDLHVSKTLLVSLQVLSVEFKTMSNYFPNNEWWKATPPNEVKSFNSCHHSRNWKDIPLLKEKYKLAVSGNTLVKKT